MSDAGRVWPGAGCGGGVGYAWMGRAARRPRDTCVWFESFLYRCGRLKSAIHATDGVRACAHAALERAIGEPQSDGRRDPDLIVTRLLRFYCRNAVCVVCAAVSEC